MRMRLRYFISVIFILFSISLFAQKEKSNFDLRYNYFGLGWVRVDDNGEPSPDLSRSVTNYVAYPSVITFGKFFENGLRFDLSAFYTELDKSVYGSRYSPPGLMLSCDLNVGYSMKIIGGNSGGFSAKKRAAEFSLDVYPSIGGGYTYRSLSVPQLVNSATANFGGGINMWVLKNSIGMNLQSLGKFGIKSNFPRSATNYIEYSVSLLYRIKNQSGLPGNLNKERKKF